MADLATKNKINTLKKQIADAEKTGDLNRITTLKKQLANFEANAIKVGKINPTTVTAEGKKYKPGQIFTIAPIKSVMSFTAYNPNPAEAEIDEAKGFVKYLAKKLKTKYGKKATAKAEEAWKKAKKSYDTSSDYEKIAGTAKIIAANMLKSRKKKVTEDGAAPIAATPQTNMVGTTLTGDIKPFAAKLGEKPNYDKPGKYKADPKKIFRRKVKATKPPKRNESVENFIDNLFE